MNVSGTLNRSRLRGLSVAKPNLAAVKRLQRPSRISLLIALLAVVLLAGASFALIRNSSFVAVQDIKVVGLSGYYDRAARAALVKEAQAMTTMNVNDSQLSAAAGEFVDVAGIRTDAKLPHGLTIYVDVRRAVATAKIGTQVVALTGSGQILENARELTALPQIKVTGALGKGKIGDPKALEALTVLGAAPDVLLRKVRVIEWKKSGIVIVLDKNLALYFGTSQRSSAKWHAAAAVLASNASKGASYIDLRVPDRPAIGGLGAAPTTPKPASLADPLPAAPAAAPTTGVTPATSQQQTPSTTTQAPANTQQQAPATGQNTQAPAAGAATPNGTG